MEKVIRVGLDTSKQVFQVHGVDASERVVLRKQLRRGQVEEFFAGLDRCLIGLEACGGSHHWGRVLQRLGHDVRLLAPQYVKPYVHRNKSDRIDAAAICEALSRPSMRFVPVKSEAAQTAAMVLSTRDLLVKQRTMLINAIRGHAAEFGVIGAKGVGEVGSLLERARAGLAPAAWAQLEILAGQLASLQQQIGRIEAQLMAMHKSSQASLRLATIPGIGPITAMTLLVKVGDPKVFASARHFAAWIGLTPRENSTAGRQRLGRISRQGDATLRRLLVVGATALVKLARRPSRTKPGSSKPDRGEAWLRALLARKPAKLAAVAQANKMARTAWAMMCSGQVWRAHTD